MFPGKEVHAFVDTRRRLDTVVTQERGTDIVGFAYRVTAAQSAADQAKKKLYIALRSTDKTIKHKDVGEDVFPDVTSWSTVTEVDERKVIKHNHIEDGLSDADFPSGTDAQNKAWHKQTWEKAHCKLIYGVVVENE